MGNLIELRRFMKFTFLGIHSTSVTVVKHIKNLILLCVYINSSSCTHLSIFFVSSLSHKIWKLLKRTHSTEFQHVQQPPLPWRERKNKKWWRRKFYIKFGIIKRKLWDVNNGIISKFFFVALFWRVNWGYVFVLSAIFSILKHLMLVFLWLRI